MTSTDTPDNATKPKRSASVQRRTTGRPRKYAWEPVREAFVEGLGSDDAKTWPNLRELGEHFDIPYIRVREMAAKERWTDLRNSYMTTLESHRQKERARQLAKDAVQFDSNALNVAKLGIAMVTARMSEMARVVQEHETERKRQLDRAERGMDFKLDKTTETNIRASELDLLSKAALQWHQLGQRALGTDVMSANITVQGEIEHTISVTQELMRDDPERLAGFLAAAERTGILQITNNQIVEGEVMHEESSFEADQETGE